jgi:predicted transposase YdaD
MEKSDRSPFDTVMKQLAGRDPQAWVSFLLSHAVYESDLNRELTLTNKVKADVLFHVTWDDEPIVLHIEFQSRSDSNMPQRVWEYNTSTRLLYKKPVYSVVIYVREVPSVTEPEYELRFRNGHLVGWFSFGQVKLWEIEPEVLEQPHLSGLLPLLPLMKNGKNRATIDRMMRKLEQVGMDNDPDALWSAAMISSFALESKHNTQWLKERYPAMLDFLEESPLYQEILEKGEQRGIERGIEQGIERGIEQGLLGFVELRFPSLLVQARQIIERGMSLQQLLTLQKKLYPANTVEEARAALQGA